MNDELDRESKGLEPSHSATTPGTVEIIYAVKELLSSKEAKESVDSWLEKTAKLFGQTAGSKLLVTFSSIAMMSIAFLCIGALGWFHLVSDGTTGALAGMIVGYFFKKNS